MAMKKKKTKKASAPEKYISPQSQVRPNRPWLPNRAGIGKSFGALLGRVKSYIIPGKPAEA